ncbi:MAG: 23S rRNA (adenine(2503)-C(2))-methyltransferase RlmN [Clostridia bacterium]|nr:23S rRNA (adenine(2503)-C(2))-methyltransferase RlmN [Clostridia bacterium]MBQ9957425.1 23S rRNA (adenine(2503)-C(2))-methyltransferase RlmN [Clostridia bacterium]
MVKKDIKSMTLTEIEAEMKALGQPKFRAAQIFDWLQKRCVTTFDEMTNLSKELRSLLDDGYYIANCEIEDRFDSKLDETVKYLFRLNDGECIESVLMKYEHGWSICISSQVGCRMGCKFCASTIGGFVRSLTASEMLSQIMTAQKDRGIRISNIVMMGIGEPFDNFDNVVRFLALVGDEKGLNIGMRHISLSTCGRVDGIRRFMELDSQITLSVSLHAPNDRIRNTMMPINKKWNVAELISACRDYFNRTGRRISFEYALIKGVNDSRECADELIRLLKGLVCHINLIPVNKVKENNYEKSDRVREFCNYLNQNGMNATVRRTLGSDISASCGQLRQKHTQNGTKL